MAEPQRACFLPQFRTYQYTTSICFSLHAQKVIENGNEEPTSYTKGQGSVAKSRILNTKVVSGREQSSAPSHTRNRARSAYPAGAGV